MGIYTSQREAKRQLLQRLQRVVVKVGSSVLATEAGVNRAQINALVAGVLALRARGIEVSIVSSGAVAAGRVRLQMPTPLHSVPQRQAAAAVGQIDLMALYKEYASAYGMQIAQVLLTHDDLANRERHLNARHTIETLLAAKVVPIANENDTVAVAELTSFGDNDHLSSLIAGLVDADLLILLSDIDGLYTKNPRAYDDARLVPLIEDIDHAERSYDIAGRGPLGTGGMASKFGAARTAAAAGIPTVIAKGFQQGVLQAICDPQCTVGTLFTPSGDRLKRRKHWIGYSQSPQGTLMVDKGAHTALIHGGRSLLPKGLVAVRGTFRAGDCVRCCAPDGTEFARGLVNYSAEELQRIKGLHSIHIEETLGYKFTDEVIHRNDFVLL